MPFIKVEQLPCLELFPGIASHLFAGERLMLSFLELREGSVVPEHRHPHEQAGLVLEGKLYFKIGAEEQVLEPGAAFLIPPDTLHRGFVVAGPARVLDIFSPPREDYLKRCRGEKIDE